MLPSPLDALAEWALVGVRLVGGVGSITLAAALVYLVRDTYVERGDAAESRERQTDLQERQTRLLAANHEPVVRRGDWTERAPDLLAVELTNEGAGVARDLRLAVDLDATNDAFDVRGESVPLYRLSGDAIDTQEADLRAGETATFVAPLAVELAATGAFSDSTAPFSAAVGKLRYTGTRGASVAVAVEYGNVLGERTRRTVLSGAFPLVEGLDFPAAMRLRTDDYLDGPAADRDGGFSPHRLLSGDATVMPEAAVSYFTAPGRRPTEYVLRVGVDLSGADLVKFTRGDRVVASVDRETDGPVAVCGGDAEEPALEHGEVLHVHAVSGGNEVEIDCFAAPDAVPLPPRLPRAGESPRGADCDAARAERSDPVRRSSSADSTDGAPADGASGDAANPTAAEGTSGGADGPTGSAEAATEPRPAEPKSEPKPDAEPETETRSASDGDADADDDTDDDAALADAAASAEPDRPDRSNR